MRKTTPSHIIALVWLLVAHLFTVMALANAWQMAGHSSLSNPDLAPVCTGNGVKWVSMSQFYQTGKVIFVEPPEDDSPQKIKVQMQCTLCVLNDTPQDTHIAFSSSITTPEFTQNALFSLAENHTRLKLSSCSARAPPVTV